MGRPKNERIWKHFRIVDSKSVQCHYCDKKYKIGNVNRMSAHLSKCFKCPEVVRNESKQIVGSRSLKRVPFQPTRLENEPSEVMENVSMGSSVTGCSQTISTNLDKENIPFTSARDEIMMTNDNQDILNEKLAKALIISGAPISLIEHPLWIDFFQSLQPSYTLPSRKTLSTKYLNKLYSEMRKEVKAELDTVDYLHLQLDGWSNINREGVINFIISKPEPYFVESLNTEDNRHTSEYLKEEILKVMRIYGDDKFVVTIGDNARNIQKAFQLVKEVKPHIVPLNCAAHTINLLAHDLMKFESFKEFITLSIDVIKSIRNSQVLVSKLQKIVKQKKSGEKLKLPSNTRWGSYLKSLKSLENTKAALLMLAVDEHTILPNESKSTLLDDDFWTFVHQCIIVLEPITTPIFELESDQCKVHTVYMTFKNMVSRMNFVLPQVTILDNGDKHHILATVEKRMKDCVKPLHLAAYMLDPSTRGVELSPDEELAAMELIHEIANRQQINIMPELAAYKAKEGFWRKPFIWSNVKEISPVMWWKGICSSTKLSKVAVRILTAPCTSAAVERSFSAHSNIHTKKRNRLTKDNAAKMTFLKYNWNLLTKYQEAADSNDDDDGIEDEITIPQHLDISMSSDEEASTSMRDSTIDFQFVNCSPNNDQITDSDSD